MIKEIKIFGDKYKIRRTYDINDFGIGIFGYEIYDENKNFLKYISGIENLRELKNFIKIVFYKSYESTYSYYK